MNGGRRLLFRASLRPQLEILLGLAWSCSFVLGFKHSFVDSTHSSKQRAHRDTPPFLTIKKEDATPGSYSAQRPVHCSLQPATCLTNISPLLHGGAISLSPSRADVLRTHVTIFVPNGTRTARPVIPTISKNTIYDIRLQ